MFYGNVIALARVPIADIFVHSESRHYLVLQGEENAMCLNSVRNIISGSFLKMYQSPFFLARFLCYMCTAVVQVFEIGCDIYDNNAMSLAHASIPDTCILT